MGDLRVRTAEPSGRGSVASMPYGTLGSTTVVPTERVSKLQTFRPYSPSRMVAQLSTAGDYGIPLHDELTLEVRL